MWMCVLCAGAQLLSACQLRDVPANKFDPAEYSLWMNASGADSVALSVARSLQGSSAQPDSFQVQTWKRMRVQFSATLGELGYGTGPFKWKYDARERDALTRFQRDLSLASTGELDSATVYRLVEAGRALDVTPVILPGKLLMHERGWVSAHGTWKALTNKLGYPVNTVDIECNATTGICEVVSVAYASDDLSHLDRIRRNTYRITHWSETDLLATGDEMPGGDCHATLSISFPAEEVLVHQWCTGDESAGMFAHGPSEMTLKLVDGSSLALSLPGHDDLAELREKLFGPRERYMALKWKNMAIDEAVREHGQ